jgi:hypothetical protein
VAWAASFTSVAFLWHNVIGALVVVIVGLLVSAVSQRSKVKSQRSVESKIVGRVSSDPAQERE